MFFLNWHGICSSAAVGERPSPSSALGVCRLACSLLFGLTGYGPLVFGGAVAAITLVVLCASYMPEREHRK